VPPAELVRVRELLQPLRGELANRLEHPVARAAFAIAAADETLVDQRLEDVRVGARDLFGCLERATADEHRQRGEQTPFVLAEELVRPADRRPERLLARVGVTAAAEKVEPVREPREQLLDREERDSSGRELEASGDCRASCTGRRRPRLEERLVDLTCACGKQPPRVELGQRGHAVRVLAGNAQSFAARDQDPWPGGGELGDLHRHVGQ